MLNPPVTFSAKSQALEISVGTVIRVVPSRYQKGTIPPPPPVGTVFGISSLGTTREAHVVEASTGRMVIRIDQLRFTLTSLKPTEIDMMRGYPEGSGATDWVVRA